MVESLNKRIEENADKMIQSLCEVVQIPSVYGEPQPGAPFGKESRRALQYAMDLGKKLGFETVVNVASLFYHSRLVIAFRMPAQAG